MPWLSGLLPGADTGSSGDGRRAGGGGGEAAAAVGGRLEGLVRGEEEALAARTVGLGLGVRVRERRRSPLQ